MAVSHGEEMELAHFSALFSLGSCKVEGRVCVCSVFSSPSSTHSFTTSFKKAIVNHDLASMVVWCFYTSQ